MKKLSTKYLDDLYRKAAKKVYGDRCEFCGAGPDSAQIQVHHIYGRRNFGVRWDLDNAVILDANHHTFSSEFSAHQTPLEFAEFIATKRSPELLENLKQKANQNTRARFIDREAIRDSLKAIING